MSWLSRLVNVVRRDRVDRDLDEEMQFHLAARTDELITRRHAARTRRRDMPAGNSATRFSCASRAATSSCCRGSNRSCGTSASASGSVGATRPSPPRPSSLFTGHRRLHGRFLADRCADPAAVAGQRSRVADLHRACAHPGTARTASASTIPLFAQTARCEPGAGPAVRAERPIESAMRLSTTADSRRRSTGNGSREMRFAILGVKPALGRLLTPSDDLKPGQHPVAVLSYDFWTRRFGQGPGCPGPLGHDSRQAAADRRRRGEGLYRRRAGNHDGHLGADHDVGRSRHLATPVRAGFGSGAACNRV